MHVITSLQNPRVKDAVRLRDRHHRQKQGRILIDGARELHRAIAAGVKLHGCTVHLVTEGMDEGPVGWTWIASGINVEPDV